MAKKIKIIYIIPTLDMGGAERLTVDIIKNLDPEKFSVKIICLKRFGVWGLELKGRGVPLILLGQKSGFSFFSLIKLIKILRQERPDIVHTHLFGADLYGSLAARLARVKYLVSTEHNLNYGEGRLKNIIKTVIGRLFNNIIAVSEAVKDYIIKTRHLKSKKITVINNGLEVNKFFQPRGKATAVKNNRNIIIGSVGRLTRQKGFAYLIEAMAELKHKNIECLIAGDGELRPELEEKTKRLGLGNKIKFLGWQKDIKPFLDKIDIFILPSLWEGFGLVILEAGLAGLPVIASKVDGIKEIIEDNRDGLLVEPASGADLARKIQSLAEDSALAASLAVNLQTKIKNNFNIDKTAADYEKLYLKLYELS